MNSIKNIALYTENFTNPNILIANQLHFTYLVFAVGQIKLPLQKTVLAQTAGELCIPRCVILCRSFHKDMEFGASEVSLHNWSMEV